MLKLCKSIKYVYNPDKYLRRYIHYPYHAKKIGVQGAPFELGQRKPGVSLGPKILRETEFIEILQSIVGLDVRDYGDVPLQNEGCDNSSSSNDSISNQKEMELPDFQTHRYKLLSKTRHESEVGIACQKVCTEFIIYHSQHPQIAESTTQIVKDGRICLTLGGDHSIAIGSIAGVAKIYKKLGIVWVDAHSDINTTLTSLTGNMHGMSLAFLIKELEGFQAKLPSFHWLKPEVSAKSLVYIGLRDVEPFERSIINMLGIKSFSMAEVDKYGINFIVEMALDHLTTTGGVDRPLHISFDVDAMDDLEIPCTGTPVPGGLSLRESMRLMEIFHNTSNVCSIDIVEFNPRLGIGSTSGYQTARSAKAIKELIFSSFGYYRGGMPMMGQSIPKPCFKVTE